MNIFFTSENEIHHYLPTPVFLAGEIHGQRSLVGCSPWGHKELDTTEWLTLFTFLTGGTQGEKKAGHVKLSLTREAGLSRTR